MTSHPQLHCFCSQVYNLGEAWHGGPVSAPHGTASAEATIPELEPPRKGRVHTGCPTAGPEMLHACTHSCTHSAQLAGWGRPRQLRAQPLLASPCGLCSGVAQPQAQMSQVKEMDRKKQISFLTKPLWSPSHFCHFPISGGYHRALSLPRFKGRRQN